VDIAEVLKRAKAPERVVEICLDADLAAEHDELSRRLTEAQRSQTALSDGGKAAKVAKEIRDLEGRMQASVVPFRMRGLSAYRRQEWLDAHPAREGKQELFDPYTGPVALIAACCVDPQMTPEQAKELCDKLGTGQTDQLFSAAWEATNGGSAVPFSVAASVTLRASDRSSSGTGPRPAPLDLLGRPWPAPG
jgi:hypothetical protein